MSNLQDILQSAQGGKAADNLAERFGISPEQASAAMAALAPALGIGLQRAMQNPGGLGSITGQLTAPQHLSSFQTADGAHSDAGIAGGSTILGQIFGDPNVVAQIAQQASRVTGLRPELLQRMLPVIATIAAGGLISSLRSQGFGNILGQLGSAAPGTGGGAPAASGGLARLFSSLMGLFGALTGGQGQTGAAGAQAQAGLDALKKMLQPGRQTDPQHQAAIGDILGRRA
jgi:hypothetical protein